MLKDHPKGIMVMFTTEMWERFGFYIMMAILVLYMDGEFGWSDSVKGDHYGAFHSFFPFPICGFYCFAFTKRGKPPPFCVLSRMTAPRITEPRTICWA